MNNPNDEVSLAAAVDQRLAGASLSEAINEFIDLKIKDRIEYHLSNHHGFVSNSQEENEALQARLAKLEQTINESILDY